jgi:adenylate kinase family enzyme
MRSCIHIFGASGAGTSALGRELARETGLQLFEADAFLWQPTDPPYRTTRAADERLRLLRSSLISHGAWVLAGSIVGWGNGVVHLFQLAVFLHAPTEIRLARLRSRERARFGNRIALGGDMHDQHRDFIDWASRYDEGGPEIRSRRAHDRWTQTLTCPVLRLNSSESLSWLCDQVLAAMAELSNRGDR